MTRRVFALVVPALLTTSSLCAQPLFFWQAQKDGADIWLLGSVHAGADDFYPLDPRIEAAFAMADTIACELDVTDPAITSRASALVMQLGRYPAGETLRDHLAPAVWDSLAAVLAKKQLPLAMIESFRPSLVALMLAQMELQAAGLDPDQGIDRHVLMRAHADSVPVVALETVEKQANLLLGQEGEIEELILLESLAQGGQEMRELLDEMLGAWREGDAEAMADLIEDQWLEDPRLVQFHEDIILQRNRDMATLLDRRAGAATATWFVVVGAGHLVGDEGIPALLAADGWEVEQVR